MKKHLYVALVVVALATVAQDATAQCCRLFGCCRSRRAACCSRSATTQTSSRAFGRRVATTSAREFAPGVSVCSSGLCSSGFCSSGFCSNGVCSVPPIETAEPCASVGSYCFEGTRAPCDQVETTATETTSDTTETTETTEPCAPVCSPCGQTTTCANGVCTTVSTGWSTSRTRGGLLGGLLDIANATRARFGLGGLQLDATLCREAEATARHCAAIGGLQHRSGGAGSSEIIAYNYSGFSGAVDQWLASNKGHREALLSRGYTRAGVAIVNAGGRSYCCMRFM